MKGFLILLLVLSVTACNPAGRSAAPNEPNTARTQRVQQTNPQLPKPQDPQTTAKRLVNIASKVPNVSRATAIVYGKTAIVGINVPGNFDRARVGTLKYSVAEALRHDPQGAHALVTADVDIVNRIREMNQEVMRGRPVAAFANELADIVGRIIPQAPKDTRTKQTPATKK
ncbi:YhcN/YlaJ family sporulation lipoprotein [Aneurinibacillus sp. Ricciae_BoGa-3]|uniref:YhcN/YlaJ family sporulation lipoprotein n=1 Tax=Aneurinibacillus sp. Ricciae_BoGa-3 TaxID=3022697 RepID=UPI0023428079|nr:YhcN/YlaJ family sporulation lipoprotein [Aneurinibacillus sp. Ricciae_BoGa-3]WCK53109.1 YhcN/YlaJ family sporulation lipoprotein [Aneurinibacillus sp. Ricciae_BoGa-3]